MQYYDAILLQRDGEAGLCQSDTFGFWGPRSVSQGRLMMDEKVKMKCTKCSQVFRERAQRIRDGFQTNCHHCNRLITFDTTSEDINIRRALMNAKEVRMAIEARLKRDLRSKSRPLIEGNLSRTARSQLWVLAA
jgi:hypothetical protein